VQPQPKRSNDFHDGRELWVAFGGERFVEAFSPQPRVAGNLTHALGARDIAECSGNRCRVAVLTVNTLVFKIAASTAWIIWLPHDSSTHDRVFDVSYESALRQAGFSVEFIPNQGRGAAMASIESVSSQKTAFGLQGQWALSARAVLWRFGSLLSV